MVFLGFFCLIWPAHLLFLEMYVIIFTFTCVKNVFSVPNYPHYMLRNSIDVYGCNTRTNCKGYKYFCESPFGITFSMISADAFKQIIRKEGVGALWNGTFPSLLLVLNPAIQFMIYEGLKRQLRRGASREVSWKVVAAFSRYLDGKRHGNKKMQPIFPSLLPKLSSLEVFIIGAVAKAVATTVTYPLQTIQSVLRVGLTFMSIVSSS